MLFWLIRPLRFAAQLVSPHASPRQLALGFAFGVALGLVPKGNLTAAALTVLVFASRVNLGSATLSAFCFSWVGTVLDPVSHRIGLALLSISPSQALLARLHELPLVPWAAWNNSVVVGSLVLGAVQFYFTYRITLPLFTKYQPLVIDRLRKLRRTSQDAERHEVATTRRAA